MSSIHELPPHGRVQLGGSIGESDTWPLTRGQALGALALFVLALAAVALTVGVERRSETRHVVPTPPAERLTVPAFDEFVLPPMPDAWLAPDERPQELPPPRADVL